MKAPLFVAPIVLVSAFVVAQSRQTPASAPLTSVWPQKPAPACHQPPEYRIGYASDSAALISQGQGFRFQGVSWLETDLCTPGNLTMRANGEVAGGGEPTLVITLNSEPVANLDIPPTEKTYNVRIPQAGRLTLGYFNDYYLADVRVAILEKFKFSAPACQTIHVDVPAATGGSWQSTYNSASLVSDTPMSVTPCEAGQLELEVTGRAGNGVFPILKFQQEGKVIKTLSTTKKRQPVMLTLRAAPLTITLINPYGRTLADRNLNIRSLKFTPADSISP